MRPSDSGVSDKPAELVVEKGSLKRVNEMYEIARNFKRQRECIDSAPTQPGNHMVLSADTGQRSQRLLGDFVIFVRKDPGEGVAEHMPRGDRWERNVRADSAPNAIYRGCIQFSAHQPYSDLDGVLRMGVFQPISI